MKKTILSNIITGALGIISATVLVQRFYKKIISEDLHKIERLNSYYRILNSWLYLKSQKKELADYFISHNFKRIAVYGMGELGERFIEDIKQKKEITICYAIDSKGYSSQENLEIYKPDGDWYENDVDAIVVTPIFAYMEICKNLQRYTRTPILSLEEILDEL